MRTALLGLLFMTITSSTDDDKKEFKSIESAFKLQWKTKIGNASFRSNVTFTENDIIIGSNGKYFRDYYPVDKTSGVYKLNRRTGKVIAHFANESLGDMDVNGIIMYKGKLYFGNDNEEFLCTTSEGKILWRNATSGDIEHEPVMINNKGKKYIVYASELGEVSAVDPENGNHIWNYYTPDFSGWKPGDNRSAFKVKAFFSNSSAFFTKPELEDLNGDGVEDLIYMSFNSFIYSINGATGKLLWSKEKKDSSPFFQAVVKNEQSKIRMANFAYNYNSEEENYTNTLEIADSRGNIVSTRKFEEASYGIGLNYMNLNNKILLCTPDSLIVIGNNGNIETYAHGLFYNYTDWNNAEKTGNRNSYDPVFANRTFNYKENKNCVLILYQRDNANYDHGFIEIFSLDTKEVVKRLSIPAVSEMPPVIKDVNKDGYLDLLINCNDEYLYCYNLGIKA